jgi:hypothetical protein
MFSCCHNSKLFGREVACSTADKLASYSLMEYFEKSRPYVHILKAIKVLGQLYV